MHWNILAQKLTNNDSKPNSGDPWLDWRHRSKLIKEHIFNENADIIGVCELDCYYNYARKKSQQINNEGREAQKDLVKYIEQLGYACCIAERRKGNHATAIFFKKNKFHVLM